MDGQDRDGVGVRVELGRRRVVARLDERGEVRRDEDGPVVGEQRRLRADDLEEARDVLELLLGGRRVRADQPGEDAAPAQEAVQELTGGSLVGRLRVAAQVRDERDGPRPASRGSRRRMPGCRSSSSRIAQTERLRRRAMLTIAVRSSPPRPYTSDAARA